MKGSVAKHRLALIGLIACRWLDSRSVAFAIGWIVSVLFFAAVGR